MQVTHSLSSPPSEQILETAKGRNGETEKSPIRPFSDSPIPKIFLPLLDNGNGSVMASFMMDHAAAFAGRKVVMIRASDSHANRGMNKIANAFLASDCDVWINIDADIRFRKMDVENLLSHISEERRKAGTDLKLVYGIYPKKEDAASPCLCTFASVPVPDENGLAEVRRCGRGFMLVKREVLEAMKEDNGGPALRYHNHGSDSEGAKVEWDFFPSGVVTGEFSALERMGEKANGRDGESTDSPILRFSDSGRLDKDGFPIREWISEDWYFCERARKLGYKTMVDTRIALGHVGSKDYRFGWDQITRLDSDIKSWREIQGWFDYEILYRELVREIPDGGRFVEVGCWLGRSIAAFSAFAKEAGKNIELNVVDTFEGDPSNALQATVLEAHGGSVEKPFRANMEALGVAVKVRAMKSWEAAFLSNNGSIDAVFIDGDHRYEAVLGDIKVWLPKVKPGGILAGHDIDEDGVNKAVKEVFGDKFNTRGRCWLVRL
jgi:predicted O-methyltransferase YrrM